MKMAHPVLTTLLPAVLFVPQFLTLEHGHLVLQGEDAEKGSGGTCRGGLCCLIPPSGLAGPAEALGGPASHTELGGGTGGGVISCLRGATGPDRKAEAQRREGMWLGTGRSPRQAQEGQEPGRCLPDQDLLP